MPVRSRRPSSRAGLPLLRPRRTTAAARRDLECGTPWRGKSIPMNTDPVSKNRQAQVRPRIKYGEMGLRHSRCRRSRIAAA